MIEQNLLQLCCELGLENPLPFDKEGRMTINLAPFTLEILKLAPGIYLSAPFAPLPKKEREEFLLKLMQANFLGQGTGGGVLGLKEDESFLTLSLSLPYEMNYKNFKDAIEDFVNYLAYWKTETARHEAETK